MTYIDGIGYKVTSKTEFEQIKKSIKTNQIKDLEKSLVIRELEKIKEEMKEERDSVDLSCADSFNWNIRLIDKHIAELKGESNDLS